VLRSPVAMATLESDELVGSLVDGRYTILEAMASGSMGAVYKAERVPVGKLVAIKFLHASYANDNEFLARFERETRVMSKLAHPNCVSVVDFGVWDGAPYLVMEFVAGRTLRTLIDRGPIAPARALHFARQIASGLAHAHAQGITHRDVKPANIMITEEIGTGEHVRILDFGLARLRGAVGRDATQSNVVVGTPNYMAPEQTVGGGTIDARTDVYAVGVVLFEMVAGERPFQAEDTLALLGMHRAAPVPKLADRVKDKVELPRGLQETIETAMAKSPDDRFQSAIELADAIDEIVGSRPAETGRAHIISSRKLDTVSSAPTIVDLGSTSMSATISSSRVRRPSSRAGVLLALVVLCGGAYAGWYLHNRGASKPGVTTGGTTTTTPPPADAAIAKVADAAPVAPPPPVAPDAPQVAAAAVDAAVEPPPVIDAPAPTISIDAAEPVAPGTPDGAEDGEGEIDMAPDPNVAPNPVPEKERKPDEDEAADAPKTDADAEKRTPVHSVLATTINEALRQIQDGKHDLALAGLRSLATRNPRSAYIPFLLGNLYFDQQWWSVAMDHYRVAIQKNASYRNNPTLNRNVIRMLVSKKTDNKAEYFLRRTIGKPSLPYLQAAARSDPNAYIRRYAGALARAIRSQ
jgi:eukaryotic-like serine/threonine-protein kinase